MVQNKELETDDFQFALALKFSEIETTILEYQKTWTANIPKIVYSSPISQPSQFSLKSTSFFSFFNKKNTDSDPNNYCTKSAIAKSASRNLSFEYTPFTHLIKPKGLYIYGSSGTGKTLLSMKFYDHLNIQHKMKAHFFEFMDKIHRSNYDLSKVFKSARFFRPTFRNCQANGPFLQHYFSGRVPGD